MAQANRDYFENQQEPGFAMTRKVNPYYPGYISQWF